ncbi:ligase-associated DNA damage response exonuclease [Pseudoruegeria sp. SK021]|uniref:ligase-associated DNA damage response exonuclease n=1 Tax=Pseudoruegeria sp. SK021 TaxID=1933035 RepID=UPI000A238D02|nr:ligase-associated DNA damage response exonuclease [Pseudoruegeria sp. SK021]OSP55301.1 DNA ligase-associated DEXH box helicase [Pseudoruegeria sp. SK021]
MAHPPPCLISTEHGLYCPAGDFYVDPWRPVPRALITHAHSDHARSGHGHYLSTRLTDAMMHHRLGNISSEVLAYGESRQIGDARVSFHPAGHVPGSAQIRIEVGGEVWVVSGDYKLERDGLSTPFTPVRCHCFITECTFGLPAFHWPDATSIRHDINGWWAENAAAGRISVLGAYSLGKAQRLLAALDPSIGPILCHGAVEATNAVLRREGLTLPATLPVTPDTTPQAMAGGLVLAPPAALGTQWMARFGATATGFASGWMAVRGIRRRRAADRGFVVSDHADWAGLNTAIKETGAERILVTHGYTTVFRRWLDDQGYDAQIVQTEFTGEPDDAPDQPATP